MTKKGVVHDNQFGIIPRDIAYAQISVTAKGVYMVLAQFNQAFPSQRFIAERLGVSVRTVQRALKELIKEGFVRVEERHAADGSQTSNLYHLGSMKYTPPVGEATPVSPPPRHGRRTPPVTNVVPPLSPVTDYVVQEETDKKKVTTDVVTSAPEQSSTFEEFWAVYPRKAGKTYARQVWAKVTAKTPAADIIAGAYRFRDDPNREDVYTPHPSTWLNQGRWDDDPQPSRVVAPPRKLSKVEQNMAEYQRLYGEQHEQQRSLPTLDVGVGEGWTDSYGSIGRSLGG